MAIDAIDEFAELNILSDLRLDPVSEWNERKITTNGQGLKFTGFWSGDYSKHRCTLIGREIKPMMAKVGVSHTNKNGEKIEVEVTVDTRSGPNHPPASQPPPRPNPPSQQGKPKK